MSAGGPSVKTEKLSKNEDDIWRKCKAARSQTLSQKELQSQMNLDPNSLMKALQALANKGLMIMKRGQNNQAFFTALDKNQAKLTGNLDQNETLAYNAIRVAGNMGIWLRDIRTQTNIPMAVMNKVLKALEKKEMIKLVKSVKTPTKKLYMLKEIEPAKDITGGAFFTEHGIDKQLVDSLSGVVQRFVQEKSFPRKVPKKNISDDLYVPNPIFAPSHTSKLPSPSDILNFINSSGIAKVSFDIENILQLMCMLAFEGKVEILKPIKKLHEEGWNSDLEGDGGGADEEEVERIRKERNKLVGKKRGREEVGGGVAGNGGVGAGGVEEEDEDEGGSGRERERKRSKKKGKERDLDGTDADSDDDSDSDSDAADRARRKRKKDERARKREKEKEREKREKEREKRKRVEKKLKKLKREKKKEKKRRKREKEKEKERAKRKKAKAKKSAEPSDVDMDGSDSDRLVALDEVTDKSKKKRKSKKIEFSSSSDSDSDSDSSLNTDSSEISTDSDSDSDSDSAKSSVSSSRIDTDKMKRKAKQAMDTPGSYLNGGSGSGHGMDDDNIFSSFGMMADYDLYKDPDVVYRSIRASQFSWPLAEAPCGLCPVQSFCSEMGPVNPIGCEYFEEWEKEEFELKGLGGVEGAVGKGSGIAGIVGITKRDLEF